MMHGVNAVVYKIKSRNVSLKLVNAPSMRGWDADVIFPAEISAFLSPIFLAGLVVLLLSICKAGPRFVNYRFYSVADSCYLQGERDISCVNRTLLSI